MAEGSLSQKRSAELSIFESHPYCSASVAPLCSLCDLTHQNTQIQSRVSRTRTVLYLTISPGLAMMWVGFTFVFRFRKIVKICNCSFSGQCCGILWSFFMNYSHKYQTNKYTVSHEKNQMKIYSWLPCAADTGPPRFLIQTRKVNFCIKNLAQISSIISTIVVVRCGRCNNIQKCCYFYCKQFS